MYEYPTDELLAQFKKTMPSINLGGTTIKSFDVLNSEPSSPNLQTPKAPCIPLWHIGKRDKIEKFDISALNQLTVIHHDQNASEEELINALSNIEKSPWKICHLAIEIDRIHIGMYHIGHFDRRSKCSIILNSGELCCQFHTIQHNDNKLSISGPYIVWMHKSKHRRPIARIIEYDRPQATKVQLTEVHQHLGCQNYFSAILQQHMSLSYATWPIDILLQLSFDTSGIAHYNENIITSMNVYHNLHTAS